MNYHSFPTAVAAAAAIIIHAGNELIHRYQYSLNAQFNSDRQLTGFRVVVMDLNGFTVGNLNAAGSMD